MDKDKLASRIVLSLFVDEGGDLEASQQALIELLPFDPSEEKVAITSKTAEGFHERKITILTLLLNRRRHVRTMLFHLKDLLPEDDRESLLRQAESRLDERFHFYLRLHRKKWMEERKVALTERGDCIHIKITLIAFPKTKENVLHSLQAWLS